MDVELISTGSELLLGEIIDENAPFLSRELNRLGYNVRYHSTVGDNPVRMEAAFRHALCRADVVITTGGLGPTQGDITKEIGAKIGGRSLSYHEEIDEQITAWIQRRGRIRQDKNKRQAMIPEGAVILTNEVGTAPGIILQIEGKLLIHLPGPPKECRWMYEHRVRPWLLKELPAQGYIGSYIIAVHQVGETQLEEWVMDFIKNQSNPTLALLAKTGYIELRITAKGKHEEEVEQIIAPVKEAILQRLQEHSVMVSEGEESIEMLLAKALWNKNLTISTAESCTGGMVSETLTKVAGSSSYLRGAAVTYCNEIKEKILHVSGQTLKTKGAVSEDTACQMAAGVRALYETELAVSTTGIAGPGGGTATKPVGLVYIGVSGPYGTYAKGHLFTGNREEIRQKATAQALYLALQYIQTHY